jgi:hypothetical protein
MNTGRQKRKWLHISTAEKNAASCISRIMKILRLYSSIISQSPTRLPNKRLASRILSQVRRFLKQFAQDPKFALKAYGHGMFRARWTRALSWPEPRRTNMRSFGRTKTVHCASGFKAGCRPPGEPRHVWNWSDARESGSTGKGAHLDRRLHATSTGKPSNYVGSKLGLKAHSVIKSLHFYLGRRSGGPCAKTRNSKVNQWKIFGMYGRQNVTSRDKSRDVPSRMSIKVGLIVMRHQV